jgi:hypothetical protein
MQAPLPGTACGSRVQRSSSRAAARTAVRLHALAPGVDRTSEGARQVPGHLGCASNASPTRARAPQPRMHGLHVPRQHATPSPQAAKLQRTGEEVDALSARLASADRVRLGHNQWPGCRALPGGRELPGGALGRLRRGRARRVGPIASMAGVAPGQRPPSPPPRPCRPWASSCRWVRTPPLRLLTPGWRPSWQRRWVQHPSARSSGAPLSPAPTRGRWTARTCSARPAGRQRQPAHEPGGGGEGHAQDQPRGGRAGGSLLPRLR